MMAPDVGTPPTMTPAQSVWQHVETGRDKTALLHRLAMEGAEHDLVRSCAVELSRGLAPGDWIGFQRRAHYFVSQLPYLGECVETFQPASLTLQRGGDCDDHVLTHAALSWSLRLPFYVVPVTDIDSPAHYSLQVGGPRADEPWGDERTTWYDSETTEPAPFGARWSSL